MVREGDHSRVHGRATALTVVLPLRWWGRWYLAAWFAALRAPRLRRFAFKTVDPLRFISAIRWSLLPPFERGRPRLGRDPDRRWQLLFESNFDGDWDEYLDTFGAVLGRPLETIIGPGLGYPGLTTPDLFKAYAKVHDAVPALYQAAHPTLTANEVRHEMAARRRGSAAAIAGEGYGRTRPRWTTVLLPLRPGRSSAARRAAAGLGPDPSRGRSSLLLESGAVHFARAVVLERPAGSWLLLTFTHDGPFEPIARSLVAAGDREADGSGDQSRVRALLELTEGAPSPTAPDESVVAHLLAHRPASARHRLTYCAYPTATVGELADMVARPTRHRRWPDPEQES